MVRESPVTEDYRTELADPRAEKTADANIKT